MGTEDPSDRFVPVPLRTPALAADVLSAFRDEVPRVAELTIDRVVAEVPQYAGALEGQYRAALERGVRMAFDGFVALMAGDAESSGAVAKVRRGAYTLGREEARARRSIDGLLAAYRVGARVHWDELSRTALEHRVSAPDMADLAALILGYNHTLSAASVAGHEDETRAMGRVRERRLERLALGLVSGEPADILIARAQRADWSPPRTLTAVLLPPQVHAHTVATAFPRALVLVPGSADLPAQHDETVILVGDTDDARAAVMGALRGTSAVVGPSRPWLEAATSYRRAVRALDLARASDEPLDTEHHLLALVLRADPDGMADLRRRALAPLSGLPQPTADRLAETLRSWLLHQGRRAAVARHLAVHPQTVRYRMDQVRDRFGAALTDPQRVMELTLALAPV